MRIFLILILLIIVAPCYPQISTIKFNSSFEKEFFNSPIEKNFTNAFLAIDSTMTPEKAASINKKISNFSSDFIAKRNTFKTEEKMMKYLFDQTHAIFFEKYSLETYFPKIFSNKEFNCVTGSALYAIILEACNIPFKVKEEPTHVYIIVFPDEKNYILETTNTKFGMLSIDEKAIEKEINFLIEQKIILKDDVNKLGYKQVYLNTFYPEGFISVQNLVGLQYYNESVQYINTKNYTKALNSIRKASYYYPSKKHTIIEAQLLVSLLENVFYNTYNDINNLAQYLNIDGTIKNDIENIYRKILYENLFKNDNIAFTDSAFSILSNNVKDTSIINEIKKIHYFGYADYYNKKSNTVTALQYADSAYYMNINNIEVKNFIANVIIYLNSGGRGVSAIKKMDDYAIQYPFLKENYTFQSMYFYNYTYLTAVYFKDDNITKATIYLNKIEAMLDKYKENLKYDSELMGYAYAEAGAYYYRIKNYTKAKNILNRGLVLVPGHNELEERLKIVLEKF